MLYYIFIFLYVPAFFVLQKILFRKCIRTLCHFIPLILIGCMYIALFVAFIPNSCTQFLLPFLPILFIINTLALLMDIFLLLFEKV